MIDQMSLRALPPAERARVIYGEAQSAMSRRLWQAALGNGGDDAATSSPGILGGGSADRSTLDTLLALLKTEGAGDAAPIPVVTPAADATVEPAQEAAAGQVAGLGPNARYASLIDAAATRTGIPAAALAAIVDAEAGKGTDGSWQAFSRNPRSSAAGLGQFLGGTWQGMAETEGTSLNQMARARGWLGDNGVVLPGARAALLALRYDPATAINGIADYARRNLDGLRRAGVGGDVAGSDGADGTAKLAYLGHHLGLGDAVRFLRGGLGESRARVLLGAQIGAASSERRIEAAGGASAAHRSWLLGYLDHKVRPERFAAAIG